MIRRAAVGLAAVAAVGLGIALLAGGRSGGAGTERYRVDAIFDNARGLIAGQLVEIAGGRVGEISDVSVTDEAKARISMEVDARFAPFRQDAECTIRPQGLIAENFVQCDPGTPGAPELAAQGGRPPTVPLARTSQPVNLVDLFAIWNVPTRDRLAVLLSQLGVATAGRGEDIDAILRRANPALAQARRLIRTLVAQRDALLSAVDRSDRALVRIAPHVPAARALLRQAAATLTRTGARSGELAESVRRLPGLLGAARPALRGLGALARRGRPLLARLRASAPAAIALTADGPRLARTARPAIARLAPVLERGAGIVRRAVPLTRALRVYLRQSLPSAKIAGELLPQLDERGFPDNFARFVFYATLATSRFDGTSHILPAHVDLNDCGQYAEAPQPGCSANYGAGPAATTSRANRRLLDYLLGR